MNEVEIMTLLYKRSEEALPALQRSYGALCRQIMSHILSDSRDMEECLQDTLLRVWDSIPPERPNSLKAYMVRIARNRALDQNRYNHRQIRNSDLSEAFEELEETLSQGGDPEELLMRHEISHVINDFLRAQPKEYRIMFVRRYFYGESVSQIAQNFQCTEGKVRTALFRTRNRLYEQLKKEGDLT